MISDTSPEIARLALRMRREQTVDERLNCGLDFSVFGLGLESGALRNRYPDATWEQLRPLLGWKRYRDVIPAGVSWPNGPIAMRVMPPVAVLQALDSMGIVYAIGGGMAIGAHGEARLVNDVDVLARIDKADWRAAFGDGFCELSDGSMLAMDEVIKVDFVPKDEECFGDSRLERRVWIRPRILDGRALPVWSAEDALLSTMRWPKGEYWRDMLGIVDVQESRLDWRYLEDWAPRLGVADLLAKLPRYS